MSSASLRPLPDPEISLRDARDFIIGSPLARRALASGEPALTLFLHDLLDAVYRLVQSCHLPEFTDHGLPHLCSLVDRISRWELPAGGTRLSEELTSEEATILLVATLTHDIGMLSQNPMDLPDDSAHLKSKALWADVAAWVRQTHVDRLDKLVRRVLRGLGHDTFLESNTFATAVEVAKSHQRWPWEWEGAWTADPRIRGLAAVVAVADLLDEDAARCDTSTLLEHREGNELNRAHWLRHALTSNRVLIQRARIDVKMVRPPDTTDLLKPVFSALRNHFRLCALYDAELHAVNAPITNIDLHPSTGIPEGIDPSLAAWNRIRGFSTENALCFQLLRTFMSLVLKDERKCTKVTLEHLRVASLEDVDDRLLELSRGSEEPRTEYEMTFRAISNLGPE